MLGEQGSGPGRGAASTWSYEAGYHCGSSLGALSLHYPSKGRGDGGIFQQVLLATS